MPTLFLSHEACLGHKTVDGHPECPKRLRAILDHLRARPSLALEWRESSPAGWTDLRLAHRQSYIDHVIARIPEQDCWTLDEDTVVSPGSLLAARHAAGAVLDALDAVMAGEAGRAFCAVRPPGHHAGSAHSGGFCLFNNIAIGARAARGHYGLRRIAIVDVDAHHGNGSQEIFWHDPDTLFISLHQEDLQSSGRAEERGAYDNALNLPLPPRADGSMFQRVLETQVLPRLRAFGPEILLVSAGFDAHRYDPLAGLLLVEEDFRRLARSLCQTADRLCFGRVIAVLEGGYELSVLGSSVAAFIRGMNES